jgi:hypothetical protein
VDAVLVVFVYVHSTQHMMDGFNPGIGHS